MDASTDLRVGQLTPRARPLTPAAAQNVAAFWEAAAASVGGTTRRFSWGVFANQDSVWPSANNAILTERSAARIVVDDLRETAAASLAYRIWDFWSSADPGPPFEARRLPVMVLERRAVSAAPPELEIRRITTEAEHRTWTEVVLEGYGVPRRGLRMPTPTGPTILGDARVGMYLGTSGGRPVAACLSFAAAGAVGIYWVATVPGARRQGFGAAVTARAASDAALPVVLESSEMGVGVYRSIGFDEVGTVTIWVKSGMG